MNSSTLSGDEDDMFAASRDDDLYEGEGTPFGKGGGLFSGSGALFDDREGEEGEGGEGEKPSRKQDPEASIRSKSTTSGGGDLFGDEGEDLLRSSLT